MDAELVSTVTDAIFVPKNANSVVKPVLMSHGTLECRNMKESRRFYEEFLGLEVVRHAQPSMTIRCGIKFSVVCVEVGDAVHPMSLLNHWGLDVQSREEVDEAYRQAMALKEKYAIRNIVEPSTRHGIYSFYLEDLDHNYWEIQHYDGFQHDDVFDFGDRFPME